MNKEPSDILILSGNGENRERGESEIGATMIQLIDRLMTPQEKASSLPYEESLSRHVIQAEQQPLLLSSALMVDLHCQLVSENGHHWLVAFLGLPGALTTTITHWVAVGKACGDTNSSSMSSLKSTVSLPGGNTDFVWSPNCWRTDVPAYFRFTFEIIEENIHYAALPATLQMSYTCDDYCVSVNIANTKIDEPTLNWTNFRSPT